MSTHREIYDKVYRAIPVPASLPLETSRHDYRRSTTEKIMDKVHKGYSVEESFYRVTGQYFGKKTSKGKHRKNVPSSPWVRGVAAGAVLSAASVLGIATAATLSPNTTPEVASVFAAKDDLSDSASQQGEKTILVVGMDTRPEKDAGDGSAADVPGSRTDAIAVVNITPEKENKVSVVSIPRDTGVDTSQCSSDQSTSTIEKINSVYENYGMECLAQITGDMTGKTLDGSAAVSFESFVKLIDTIGGVDITTRSAVVDDTLGTIIPHAGTHHVDGKTALDYSRARKVQGTEKSDLGRVKRQQQVGEAVISALGKSSYATKLSAAKSLLTDVFPDIKTDGLSTMDMLSLLNFARGMSPEDITTTTIPVTGEDGMGNLTYDEGKARTAFSPRTITQGEEVSDGTSVTPGEK